MAYIGTAALKELWGRIKNYFSLKSETVKNITRNGTTFTATRANGTTFTFDQKDTTYSTMTGATASTNGKAGLVPAPSAGNQDYYLKADGTWTALDGKAAVGHKHVIADVDGLQAALDAKASTGTATTSAAGLMSAADKSKLDGIGAAMASEVSALRTRMDDAESSIAELAKRLPIYYYTDVPSESSITEKPQLAVIKGGAVYLVE